jgi:transposase-like protein
MPRKRKLTPAAVRKIFQSSDTAAAIAPQFGVSAGMIHMIRQGRRYNEITQGLVAPKRARGRRAATKQTAQLDLGALADAILDRLVARLRGRR